MRAICIATVEALWGEGYIVPGGEAETLRLAKPMGLSAASSLILVGAGTGGPARSIASNLGVWVTGFEANERLGFKPDLREYGIGAQILLDLGLKSIRVLTNNPKKLVGLEGYGLRVLDGVRIEAPTTEENASYLRTKRSKLGHLLAS